MQPLLSREDRYRGHLLSFQSVGYQVSGPLMDSWVKAVLGALMVKSGKTLKWAQPGL